MDKHTYITNEIAGNEVTYSRHGIALNSLLLKKKLCF